MKTIQQLLLAVSFTSVAALSGSAIAAPATPVKPVVRLEPMVIVGHRVPVVRLDTMVVVGHRDSGSFAGTFAKAAVTPAVQRRVTL